jgi:hypothetical protein
MIIIHIISEKDKEYSIFLRTRKVSDKNYECGGSYNVEWFIHKNWTLKGYYRSVQT